MTDEHAFPDREHAAERYLLGEMSDDDRDRYEDHVFSCAECAEDVRTTAAFLDDVRSYVAPRFPARTNAAPAVSRPVSSGAAWHRSAVVPWALAASLLLFTGYQSLVLVPGLRDQVPPRNPDVVALRPESRGELYVIRTAEAENGIVLDLDTNDVQEGTVLEYKMTTAAGREVMSGRKPAPRSGARLSLLLFPSDLRELTRYDVSVQEAGTGRVIGVFRFVRQN